jgi:pSer/pThr/pTyr-binding forkhead associated (FHA) protein/predicted Ser/Thr protein kinase
VVEPPLVEIAAGTVIGGYRIVSLLGQGGMGVVYLAEKVDSGQRVALKLLTPDLARSSGFRERFVREANYASSMRHPNVIEVYDAGEQDDVLYIAMQFVEGEDLKSLLTREGRLDAQRTVGILGQIASALDAAHSTGLMHRDIKPGNVMIAAGSPEHCYLTDFGLSKNPSSDSIALTAQGEFVGTIDYTAPELVLGKKADSRLDVYSLGCLFYECLTGAPPFPKERDVEVLYAHIQDPVPKVTAMRPELPSALDDVIAKAMAKKPDDRFPTCGAFIDAARAIVGEPAAAPPPPPPPPPGVSPAGVAAGGAPPPPPPPPPGVPPAGSVPPPPAPGAPPAPAPAAPAPAPPPAAAAPESATPVPSPVVAGANVPTDAPPSPGGGDAVPEAIELRVTDGPAAGNVLRVAGEELLIGRQAPGQGKLGNDIEISRRHARVTREATGFVIEDLGSTNGTFVNGERITGARGLSAGDKLEMGDTKLVVEVPEPVEDKVIAPTGAPPAVTTFAAIPTDLPPEGAGEAAPAEPAAEAAPEPAPAAPEPEAVAAPEPEVAAPAAEPAVEAAPEPEVAAAPEPEAAAPAEPAVEAAPEPEVAAAPQEAAAPEPEPSTEPMPAAQLPADPAPEAEAAMEAVERADAALADAAAATPPPEPGTAAEPSAPPAPPEPEPAAAAPPAPEPEPAAAAPPPTPLLVASSGPLSVRVEQDQESGDLTVHLDDGTSPARFVRRGGSWAVDDA